MIRPLVLGHRGACAHSPENTIASFRRSLDDGADGFELDVQLSKDGVPVVIHDWTVDRCSPGTGAVKDLSSDELVALDVGSWFGTDFASEKLPRLADVLAAFPDAKLVDIELKQEVVKNTGLEEAVLREVKTAGAGERVMFSSFNPFVMRRTARLAPEMRRAYIYSPDVKPKVLASGLGRRFSKAGIMKPDVAHLGQIGRAHV